MPSSIPYDPSLVLANVVHPELLDNIKGISAAQAPADATQERLNSLIAMRRSFDMTKTEIINLGIPTEDLEKETDDLNKQITAAAKDYAAAKIAAEKTIQPLRAKIQTVHADVESPVDYVRTQTKTMPLAADSLNMDVQYFSVDQNSQSAGTFASTVSSYIAATTAWMGINTSTQMTKAAAKQISQQMQNHDIAGTLVLSVNCTHKNALLLAPFALNVDKGIRVWNKLFPGDKIKVNDPDDIAQIATRDATADEKSFSIISGVTYGSSFVGMVHVLNTTDTSVSEKMSSLATTLQAQMDAGAWFEQASGGFGVNASFGDDVKNLLSTQNITSHVTLISMGILPSIVASNVKLAVQQFAEFDPKSSMAAIATLSAATGESQESVKSSADAARMGGQMTSMRAADIKGTLSALQTLDDQENKMLDINSMMNALEDFLKKAAGDGQGEAVGVPLNYYLKDITAAMLAEMWVSKYLPGRYLTLQNDDLPPAGGAQAANGASNGAANTDTGASAAAPLAASTSTAPAAADAEPATPPA